MLFSEAQRLAKEAVVWLHRNKVHINMFKAAGKLPKYSDEIWAKMMAEAILSFSEGLDAETDSRTADKSLYESVENLVGPDAFKTIAILVAAVGSNKVRRPIEISFENIDPATLLKSQEDKATYNQAAQIIAHEPYFWGNQSNVQEAHSKIQSLSATPGINPDLARYLGWVSAKYMQRADELTHQTIKAPVGIEPPKEMGYGAGPTPMLGPEEFTTVGRKRVAFARRFLS